MVNECEIANQGVSSLSRYPHAENRVRGLRAAVADFSPTLDLPPLPDTARLHPGSHHPKLDDKPAEGTHAHACMDARGHTCACLGVPPLGGQDGTVLPTLTSSPSLLQSSLLLR